MALPIENTLATGVLGIHRLGEGPAQPTLSELRSIVQTVERCGYDSMWAGDHISFPLPMMDPLLQIAQAAAVSTRLGFGTSVYLLPLRHPAPVAKQVSTLDILTEGRLVFGVGLGGEFAKEYEACGIPLAERGARLTESIGVLKKFWTGEPATHEGRFFRFSGVTMQPAPRQAGGPPIWCGGRSDAALARAGRLADGWISYVVTPEMFADALKKIEQAAGEAQRVLSGYGTAHVLITRVDDTYEKAFETANALLSARYAMDFSKATRRYAAIGRAEQVAEKARAFFDAGVRHLILDFVGPPEQHPSQIERFAAEVLPLLKDLRA